MMAHLIEKPMSEIRVMVTRKTHKARGAGWEIDIRDYARSLGYDAERLARAGSKDEGDVSIRAVNISGTAIVEAKAPGADGVISLPAWLREAKVEAGHYATARGIEVSSLIPMVCIKARGKSIEEAYVVMRLGDIIK